ncbi:hypothetical protein B0H14DRAFT_3485233 [Mycena olivaceomarginata]|nr:hypothetical protein B0H14DRAFT_3485233 [Mycena olivaceomarginata]
MRSTTNWSSSVTNFLVEARRPVFLTLRKMTRILMKVEILDAELKKAAKFFAFLKLLNPTDDVTKILVLGSKHVVATLETIEKGANFLVDVLMQMIVNNYQDITEEHKFLVANLNGYDMILGTAWLFQHKGSLPLGCSLEQLALRALNRQ